MDLQVLDNKMPVKAIPEEKLNEIILMHFTPWLAGQLSLNGETAIERLKIALPAIKQHCWSFGFDEIKRMFEMYVDNKLGIEPIPNYFDRILFGKIAAAYKQQRPVKKKELPIPEISEAEKILRINKGILNCYSDFKSTGFISAGYVWVYDHLDEVGLIKYSKDEKIEMMRKARSKEKSEVDMSKAGAKNIIEMIEDKSSARVTNRAKRMLLENYFQTVTKDELADLLNKSVTTT